MNILDHVKAKLENTLYDLDIELTTIYENRIRVLQAELIADLQSSNLSESEKSDVADTIQQIIDFGHPTTQVAIDNIFLIKE